MPSGRLRCWRPTCSARFRSPSLLRGSLAREKDLVIEFDDSERQAALEEARLGVQQVDEQIKQVKATQAIQASQDTVDLLTARYTVRRAELNVQQNPSWTPSTPRRTS